MNRLSMTLVQKLVAATGLSVLAVAAAQAAEPPSGGPFTSVNPAPGTCTEGVTCDTFQLNLMIPAGTLGRVNFEIHWQDTSNDFDLFVFDANGNEVDSSGAGSTESEQVAIGGLRPGTYQVVTNAFATVNAPYDGMITLQEIADAPAEEELGLSDEIGFGADTVVDFGSGGGEPFIRADNEGNIFDTSPFGLSTTASLLWKSIDGGRSYIPLGTPVVRDSVVGAGGGDSHVDFDAQNRLYFVDLSGACVTAAVSLDGGNTFSPERTNQIVCVSEQNPDAIGDDRQWVGAFGDGIAYTTFRNLLAGSFWMFRTEDAGLNWDTGRLLGSVSQSGPFQVDKQKRRITVPTESGALKTGEAILSYQVFYRGTNLRVFRVADFDDGAPLVINDLSIVDPGESVSNVFPVLAVDRGGNLYAAWSQGADTIFMATSGDFGATWSAPVRVSTGAGTNIMPWIEAGDPGRVDIVWYHGSLKGNPNDPDNEWNIFMGQSLNALDAVPEFRFAQVNQTVIHRGEICLRGLACDIDGADRSFLEFPSVTIDERGAAVVTFNDNTNQIPVTYVMSSTQTRGPSLFASVGALDTDPGTVTIESPEAGQAMPPEFIASGTHSLPPANFDRDEVGDARFPDHGPVIGASIPALDIRSVSVSEDAEALIFRMTLADLSGLATAAAQAGGDGVAFVVQWDHNDDIHWAGAEVRAGVPVFHNGIIGAISIRPDNSKYYTFRTQPTESLGVEGSIEGNTVTLRVPRNVIGSPEDGDRLFTVTGYALSQRGPFTADVGTATDRDLANLPIQVDASGAFAYTVGEGARREGVVEVAVDDATFAAAREAELVDVTGGDDRWEAAVGELAAGPHTLFVRQRIAGRDASPAVSVDFEVTATVQRVVNDLVRLIADNSTFDDGVAAFDLRLDNTSDTPVFTPLQAEVTALSSASGTVTVANADNGEPGVGASWSYDGQVGGDGELSPAETSAARRLAFNDASGEPFTVRLDVLGHLEHGSAGTSEADGAGEGTSSEPGDVTSVVFELTVNPLLNTIRIEIL
jgi:hypothetical protein